MKRTDIKGNKELNADKRRLQLKKIDVGNNTYEFSTQELHPFSELSNCISLNSFQKIKQNCKRCCTNPDRRVV